MSSPGFSAECSRRVFVLLQLEVLVKRTAHNLLKKAQIIKRANTNNCKNKIICGLIKPVTCDLRARLLEFYLITYIVIFKHFTFICFKFSDWKEHWRHLFKASTRRSLFQNWASFLASFALAMFYYTIKAASNQSFKSVNLSVTIYRQSRRHYMTRTKYIFSV